jgi:hypothetical protein
MVVPGVVLILIGVVFLLGGPIFARTRNSRANPDHASTFVAIDRVWFVVAGLGAIIIGVLIATGVFHH